MSVLSDRLAHGACPFLVGHAKHLDAPFGERVGNRVLGALDEPQSAGRFGVVRALAARHPDCPAEIRRGGAAAGHGVDDGDHDLGPIRLGDEFVQLFSIAVGNRAQQGSRRCIEPHPDVDVRLGVGLGSELSTDGDAPRLPGSEGLLVLGLACHTPIESG